MHDDVVAHIRERVATMRKIIAMAHDPEMIAMVEGMIAQAEADISRLEAEKAAAPIEHGPQLES
jgi:hypothetical protein